MAALRFNTNNSGEFTLASRKAAIVWIAAFALFGCGKNDQGAQPGQVMFQIDPEPFKIALAQAKAQLAQQQALVTQTAREENRLQGLLATQSISQREYDNAVSDSAMAQATLQQAAANVHEAELNLSYTKVEAPVNGIAGRFQLSEGVLVAANTTLLTTVVQI